MNYSTMAFLADDNVKAVECIFTEEHYNGSRNDNPKRYTYKTTLDLEPGDLVLVECAGASNYFGYCCVRVVDVDVEIDMNAGHGYKWVVDKIDTKKIEETKKAEKELIKHIKKLEMKSRKQKFRETLGIGDAKLPKLLDFLKS